MKCNMCEETNPDYFYRSNQNTCKECIKKRAKQYRLDNIEKVKEYDRNRPNKEERAIKHRERVHNCTEEEKERRREYLRQWNHKNKHKKNAHLKVSRAVMNGVLDRPKECENCGAEGKIHAHHPDYTKPLEVLWLCDTCHKQEHIKLREDDEYIEASDINKYIPIDTKTAVSQYTKKGVFITEYPSQKEASRISGTSQPNIHKCCNGTRKTAGGYIWKYSETDT